MISVRQIIIASASGWIITWVCVSSYVNRHIDCVFKIILQYLGTQNYRETAENKFYPRWIQFIHVLQQLFKCPAIKLGFIGAIIWVDIKSSYLYKFISLHDPGCYQLLSVVLPVESPCQHVSLQLLRTLQSKTWNSFIIKVQVVDHFICSSSHSHSWTVSGWNQLGTRGYHSAKKLDVLTCGLFSLSTNQLLYAVQRFKV